MTTSPALIGRQPFGPSLELERYRLDNGLTVLLAIDRQAPVLSYETWFRVGSRHETKGKGGLAHLLEHLMFNETKNLPYGAFDRRLEEVGAESNAATFLDWTYYMINAPSAAADLVIDLENERMQHLVLRDEQVASEREVVANERLQTVDDDVDGTVGELLYRTAFERHGYGLPTIGTMADIEGLRTADCRAFYDTYYAPNNATIVLVGDVDRDRVLERIARSYGGIAAATIPREEERTEPAQTAERRVGIEQPTATAKLAVGYKCPAMADADHPPLVLLAEILFGGRASRAHRELVQKLEVASEVGGQVGNFVCPSLFDIGLTARAGVSATELLEALDRVIEPLLAAPPTEEELARAVMRFELATLQGMQTVGGKAEQIGFSELVLGDPCASMSRLEAMRTTTREDLARAAQRYLVPSGRTAVLVAPGELGEPDEQDEPDEEEAA